MEATTYKYERVRFDGKTAILRIQRDTPRFLIGIEVDRFGNEVAPKGFDERQHLIDKQTITRRTPLRWNLKYAELEA